MRNSFYYCRSWKRGTQNW